MTQRFILAKADLLAISRFAAVKDIRYYHQGVMLEVGTEESRLASTDGAVLGCLRLPDVKGIAGQFIIPLDAVLRFKPKAKTSKEVVLTIEPKPATGPHYANLADPTSGESYSFPLVDGRFPDYRRVIPLTVTGDVSQLNPSLVAKFHQAAKDLGDAKGGVTLAHNAGSSFDAALVTVMDDDRFIGVCMPWKSAEPLKSRPSWVSAPMSHSDNVVHLKAA